MRHATAMPASSEHLAPAFQDLSDAIDDFRAADVDNAKHRFARVAYLLEAEPLDGFLSMALPAVDLEAWLATASGGAGSGLGSGGLPWPNDRTSSVAMRVAFARAIGADRLKFISVLIEHFRDGGSPNFLRMIQRFADSFLAPLLRDLSRVAEDRPFTPPVSELLAGVPSSGDGTVDSMVRAAIANFRDVAPRARALAVEKLWDAWERLKTLDDGKDKKASVKALLDGVEKEGAFRALLETEALALTAIGNDFQIRHFETNRAAVGKPEQLDYLFHRLLALITLLVQSRSR